MRRDAGRRRGSARGHYRRAPARSWLTAADQTRPMLCQFRPPTRGRPGRDKGRCRPSASYWGPRKKDYGVPENASDDAHDCVRAATLLKHLSIVPDRTRNRRDSAIPFNDIETRPRRCRLERRRRATRQR